MKRLADIRRWLVHLHPARQFALGLLAFALLIGAFGYINQHCGCEALPNLGDSINTLFGDFYANVTAELASIAVTVLIIDRLNERRTERQANEQLKAQLIREMGSTDNGIALRAVRELRAQGWLEDGSLRGIFLYKANLQDAELRFADLQRARIIDVNLQGADLLGTNLRMATGAAVNFQAAKLVGTNLRSSSIFACDLRGIMILEADLQDAHVQLTDFAGASLYSSNLRGIQLKDTNLRGVDLGEVNLHNISELTDQVLVTVGSLKGAILPNGRVYNGCFNLIGEPSSFFQPNVDVKNPAAMADFYGVSLEEYLAGQEWARENLADLRREAGLDPDTGWPLPATNDTESQPADASPQPAPRWNGHKASMVAHRVRR